MGELISVPMGSVWTEQLSKVVQDQMKESTIARPWSWRRVNRLIENKTKGYDFS